MLVLLVLTGGTVVGIMFCRFALGLVFHRYTDAASVVGIILLSGVPLCLLAWIIPVAIAKSQHPWREALISVVLSSLVLFGLMFVGSYDGIEGQAWAGI